MKQDRELLICRQIQNDLFKESYAGNSSCFTISTHSLQTRPSLPSEQTPECEAKKPHHNFVEERRSLDEKNKKVVETIFEHQREKEWTGEQRDTHFYAMLQLGESYERRIWEIRALIKKDKEERIKRLKMPLPPMNFLKKKKEESIQELHEKIMTAFQRRKAKKFCQKLRDLREFFQAMSFLGEIDLQKIKEIKVLCKKDKEQRIERLRVPLPKMKFLTKKPKKKEEKKISLFCPLPNLGNTCFANALIQCLYHIEVFRNEIIKTPTNDIASKREALW